jgi:hypothetical protein
MHQDVHIYYLTKQFLTFKRFLTIQLSKYVFIFCYIFIVIYSLGNFLLEDLKN